MTTRWLLIAALPAAASILFASGGAAQPGGGPPSGEPPPPFMRYLFPPELVMRHQREIGLEAEQRDAISEAIRATQASVLEVQWEMEDAERRLTELLAAEEVDEEEALEQASRVLELEARVKKAHLALLVRIKSQLTPAQRQALQRLRPGLRLPGP